MPAVVGLLEVAGEDRMHLQERVEGIRYRVDVDVADDLDGQPEIRLIGREHLFAVRELADHGSGKHP